MEENKIDFNDAEPMLRVLAMCEATVRLAHELHYGAKGEGFYSLHILADRVDFGQAIDGLKETYYLGSCHSEVPNDNVIGRFAEKIVDDAKESFDGGPEDGNNVALISRLNFVANRGAYIVEEAKRILSPMSGVCVYLDDISRIFLIVVSLTGQTLRQINK